MCAKNTSLGHLNIDSIMNNFDASDDVVKAFDIFLISEQKLVNTFPINQLAISSYNVFRRDRNRFGGGYTLTKTLHVSF